MTASCVKVLEIEEEIPIFLEEHLCKASDVIERDLINMMELLKTAVEAACEQYVTCLIQQIELTKENLQLGPIGAHWDRLTEFRVQGNELRSSLIKYQVLLERMNEIVLSHLVNPNAKHLEKIKPKLEELQKVFLARMNEIKKRETELLCANRDCIMYCSPQ